MRSMPRHLSTKGAIEDALKDFHIVDMKIDKDHNENGLPATKITVWFRKDGRVFHAVSTFAKNLGLSGTEMGVILASHMREAQPNGD